MNLSEKDQELLETWLEDQSFLNWAKQTHAKDEAKWERYFNAHLHHWEIGKVGRELVLGLPFQAIPTDPNEANKVLAHLLQKVEKHPNPVEKKQKNSAQRRHLLTYWKVAAAMVGFLCICGISYFQFFHHSEILLTTGFGDQLTTQLPDGSVLTLNANSQAKYHSSNSRKLWLRGEAFFDVKKIPGTNEPFQVFTQDLTVNVLGTSFNVKTRNDQTKVFLEEGIVRLQLENPKTDTLEMKPGDLIAYSKKQNKLKEKKSNVSALKHASWKEGTLIFHETFLQDALYEIEDIYGIQFVIKSQSIQEELISGGVPITNLEVTLQTLREVYGIEIRPEGKRYFISGENHD